MSLSNLHLVPISLALHATLAPATRNCTVSFLSIRQLCYASIVVLVRIMLKYEADCRAQLACACHTFLCQQVCQVLHFLPDLSANMCSELATYNCVGRPCTSCFSSQPVCENIGGRCAMHKLTNADVASQVD